MPAIISFINWVVRILDLLWGKFFGVIAGFFVWLFPAIKSFFSRKIATGRFFATFASLPFVKSALVFFFVSIVGVFVSTYLTLVDIYLKIRDSFELLINSGSSSDALGLFYQLANSLGIIEVLKDTYSLWSPVLISLISFVLSILYYKAVMRFITFTKQLHLFGAQ